MLIVHPCLHHQGMPSAQDLQEDWIEGFVMVDHANSNSHKKGSDAVLPDREQPEKNFTACALSPGASSSSKAANFASPAATATHTNNQAPHHETSADASTAAGGSNPAQQRAVEDLLHGPAVGTPMHDAAKRSAPIADRTPTAQAASSSAMHAARATGYDRKLACSNVESDTEVIEATQPDKSSGGISDGDSDGSSRHDSSDSPPDKDAHDSGAQDNSNGTADTAAHDSGPLDNPVGISDKDSVDGSNGSLIALMDRCNRSTSAKWLVPAATIATLGLFYWLMFGTPKSEAKRVSKHDGK